VWSSEATLVKRWERERHWHGLAKDDHRLTMLIYECSAWGEDFSRDHLDKGKNPKGSVSVCHGEASRSIGA
jgi:hypothetical protein